MCLCEYLGYAEGVNDAITCQKLNHIELNGCVLQTSVVLVSASYYSSSSSFGTIIFTITVPVLVLEP